MTEYEYGKERKYIYFEDKDGNLVQMLIKLRHEGLSRAEFFRAVMQAFIEDDPHIDSFILQYKKKKKYFRKNRQKILDKERSKTQEVVEHFGLDSSEIDNLFDIMEEEMGL